MKKQPPLHSKNLSSFFSSKKKAPNRVNFPLFREPADSSHGRACEKCISSYNVEFPFTPYPAQIQLMYKILLGLKDGKNSLLESPTGTGKSLALLCSTLAWQMREFETQLALVWMEKINKQKSIELSIKKEKCSPPVCNPLTCKSENDDSNPIKKKRIPTFIDPDSDDDFRPHKKPKSSFNKVSETSFDKIQSFAATPMPCMTSSCHSSEPIILSDSSNSMDTLEFAKRCEKPQNSTETHIPDTTTPITSPPPSKSKSFLTAPKVAWNHIGAIKTAIRQTPKIYYGTRTHQQITQVVRELSSTVYRYSPMTILGSRERLCINPDVLKSADKTEGCKQAVRHHNCKYYPRSIGDQDILKRKNLNKSWDIEDLVSLGKKEVACPYYATRSLVQDSLIVFCPYNYLIDPIVKKEMRFELHQQVVVLDEAHNIENISRESASTQISQSQLDMASNELDSARRKLPEVSQDLSHLSAMSQNLNSWLCGQDQFLTQESFETYSHSWLGPDVVKEFGSFGLTHSTMQLHNKQIENLFEALFKRKEEDEEEILDEDNVEINRFKILSSGTITMLEWLFVVLNNILRSDNKYTADYFVSITRKPISKHGHVEKRKGWISTLNLPSWERTLNFCCLNPAVAFEALANTTHSIILTSGTLTPMTSFVSELNCEFAQKFSANHIIKPEQVWIGMLSSGPQEVRIEASFRGLEQFSTQDEIGSVIVSVCETVPDGVLCFLPSYSVMDKLRERWESIGVVKKLCELKHVVWEPRGSGKSSTFKEDMNSYFESISTGRGSLLIGVCRGKVSEGIDFADAQARAVVCIGIPFPNFKDHQVQQKREYNDRRRRDGCASLLSGSQWYEVEAFRALNQALGRCIRHRNDWGAILLVDARFSNQSYYESLSKWAREKANSFPRFKEAHESLTRFIASRTENTQI